MTQTKIVFTLQDFLKIEGWVATGGQGKWAIKSGEVRVNGVVETRRGRKLSIGDRVQYAEREAMLDETYGRDPSEG